jgi:DNA repair exonuclease SbcCD nuclease subunit
MSSRSFSFVHVADLHLDSPFKGITAKNPAISDPLRSATFQAFDALIDLCIEREVQFLVVAGDIYDGEDRSLRAQLRFHDGLVRLAEKNIASYVVHGNHDPYDSRSSALSFPAKVHIFGYRAVESMPFQREGATVAVISGISHARRNETENLAKRFRRRASEPFHIGLLHCTVGSNTGHDPYAPCQLSELLEVEFDYWALGHVHEKSVLDNRSSVLYPGNTQGRSFREKGKRGCHIVTVEDGAVSNVEFYALDAIRWAEIDVGIESIPTLDRLCLALHTRVQNLAGESDGRAVICRTRLTGRGALYQELRKGNNMEELLQRVQESLASEDPFVWVQEIDFRCRPEIDPEERRKGADFLAQVLRISRELRDEPTKARQRELSDILSNRAVRGAVEGFTDDEIRAMVERAELICIDALEADE